jgi:flagellar hook protein FlgE
MLRSLYSGVSGMKNFQTKLDVIGNNIANVNTFGFKKGRVTFKDMVSQTIQGATAGGATAGTQGGINPKQVGLGSTISSIDTVDTQGSLQTTGRILDLAIQGDGYFQVKQGGSTSKYYTRAGNFYFDSQGNLVTGSGNKVLDSTGTAIQIPNIDSVENLSVGADGKITYLVSGSTTPNNIQLGLVRFKNNGGLEKVGNNLYQATPNSGTPSATPLIPGQSGAGTIVSGALEMSNVDLSEEFTEMIVAQRGFQANTKIITTSDDILQELINLKR